MEKTYKQAHKDTSHTFQVLYVYLYNYPNLNILLTLSIKNLFSVAPIIGFYSLVSTKKLLRKGNIDTTECLLCVRKFLIPNSLEWL